MALPVASGMLVPAQAQNAIPIPVPPPPLAWQKDRGWKALINRHEAAQTGAAPSQTEMGQIYMGDRGVPQDTALSLAWLKAAADQGYANAQLWLGIIYRYGDGVKADPATAAVWLRKAADQGDADAQNMLGALYADGIGVTKDTARAFMWLDLAVTLGENDFNHAKFVRHRDTLAAKMTPAQLKAARALARAWKPAPLTDDQKATKGWELLDRGRETEAMDILQPLADAGHRQAQYALAMAYLIRDNGAVNDQTTAWLLKAAQQGHPSAQGMIGAMYMTGRGVAPDRAAAREWVAKAAQQGIALAQYIHAEDLLNGYDKAPDATAGTAMMRKAADQGYGHAQYRLGQVLGGGWGAPPDKIEAYKWLLLSETYGSEATAAALLAAKQATTKGMSLGDVAEAERRAKAWVPVLPGP